MRFPYLRLPTDSDWLAPFSSPTPQCTRYIESCLLPLFELGLAPPWHVVAFTPAASTWTPRPGDAARWSRSPAPSSFLAEGGTPSTASFTKISRSLRPRCRRTRPRYRGTFASKVRFHYICSPVTDLLTAFIPIQLETRTQIVLRGLMCEPTADSDLPGYIYGLELAGTRLLCAVL